MQPEMVSISRVVCFHSSDRSRRRSSMERNVMWSPWNGPGLEHLYLRENHEQIAADGLILGVKDQVPFRVQYEITCDLQWRVRTVRVQLLSGQKQALTLQAGGEGNWISAAGETLASLG